MPIKLTKICSEFGLQEIMLYVRTHCKRQLQVMKSDKGVLEIEGIRKIRKSQWLLKKEKEGKINNLAEKIKKEFA